MNLQSFYSKIRLSIFKGSIKQSQVDGINAILKACADGGIIDERCIAYVLATAYHETAGTMQPIEEYGKGKGYDYGKKLMRTREPYTTPDVLFYGRGYVQLTWYENYQSLGKILKVDLLNHPELALTPDVAANIMIKGMTRGLFTGVSLSTYFSTTKCDWVNARKIINGLDSADKIAGYAKNFYTAIEP